MNRRGFLASLAGLPFIGTLVAKSSPLAALQKRTDAQIKLAKVKTEKAFNPRDYYGEWKFVRDGDYDKAWKKAIEDAGKSSLS